MRPSIRMRGGLAIVAAIASLSGCGAGPEPHPIHVEVADWKSFRPAWVDAPDVADRVIHATEKAAAPWGAVDLSHVTIRLVHLPSGCRDIPDVIGCATRGEDGEWLVEVSWWAPCPEATVIAHEVGHVAVQGDAGHTDPRWCRDSFWEGMATALALDVDAACAEITRARVGGECEAPRCR